MANTGNSEKIKPAQRRAIAALLSERDAKAAALAAGVGYRTICRWMVDDPAFIAGLREAESEVISAVARQLARLADNAARTLEDTLAGDATAGVKVRAAEILLDSLLKIRGLATIEERLSRLESEKQRDETKL